MQIRNYLFIPLVSKGFLEMGINLFPSYPQFIRTNSLSLLRFQYFSNSSSEEPSLINTPYDVPQTPTDQQQTPSLDDNSANNTPTPNPSSDDDSTNNPVNNALTNLLNGTNSNNPWQNNPYAQDATGVNNPPMSSPVSNQFSNKPLTPQEIHNLLLNPHTAIIGNSLVNNKIPWGNIAVKSLGIKNGNQ